MAIDARQLAALQQLQGFAIYANAVDSRLQALESGAGITPSQDTINNSGTGGSSSGSSYFVMPTFYAQANTLSSDSPATVTVTGNTTVGYTFTFGIPKGAKGDAGASSSGTGSGTSGGTTTVETPKFRMNKLREADTAGIAMTQNAQDGYYEITLSLPKAVIYGTIGGGSGSGGSGSGTGDGGSGTGGTGGGNELTDAELAQLPPSEQYSIYRATMEMQGKPEDEILGYSDWLTQVYFPNNAEKITEALKEIPAFSNLLAYSRSVWNALGYPESDVESKITEIGENAFIRSVFNGIFGEQLTAEQLNQRMEDIRTGLGNNPDVLEKTAYALVCEDISTLKEGNRKMISAVPETEPVTNSEVGTLTFWETSGSDLSGYVKYPLVGISVTHRWMPGYTYQGVTSDACADVGFQLAADKRGLWYKHRTGGIFAQSYSEWALIKDRYGFGVETRNLLCARFMGRGYGRDVASAVYDVTPNYSVLYDSYHIQNVDEGLSNQVLSRMWKDIEYGVSSGLIGFAAGSGITEEYWIYLAIKFQQTKKHFTAINMWYYENQQAGSFFTSPVYTYGSQNHNYGGVCIPVYGDAVYSGEMTASHDGRYDGGGVLLAWRFYGNPRSHMCWYMGCFDINSRGNTCTNSCAIDLTKLNEQYAATNL